MGKKMKTEAMPFELVTLILILLPVKVLLRFRCVSKSFRDLIDGDHFVKSHLLLSKETRRNLRVIEYCPPERNSPTRFQFVDINGELSKFNMLSNPLQSRRSLSTNINGSCDGLLLLRLEERIALWNPFNRHCLKVKDCPIELPEGSIERFKLGFGFHSVSNDYRVVRMSKIWVPKIGLLPFQVWIFSLKSNSWRAVKNLDSISYDLRTYGQFANGSLHWLLKEVDEDEVAYRFRQSLSILSFDLTTERFQIQKIVEPFLPPSPLSA